MDELEKDDIEGEEEAEGDDPDSDDQSSETLE